MHLPAPDAADDPRVQRQADLRRLRAALKASAAMVALMAVMYLAQGAMDWRAFAVTPGSARGLVGIMAAPLLHGSVSHLLANGTAVLLLGTLAMAVYPRATLRGLPLMWLGSGLAAWLLGDPGSHHIGASGVTHGLMFLVFVLGLLRRDRPAIAAGMIAFFLYGGMLLTVLPQEPGVSWQSHLGGALAGVLAALLLRRSDPLAARRKYSWELEEEAVAAAEAEASLEPPRPEDVPVLWRRPEPEQRGVVLRFRRGPEQDD
jgi:membrane associated rhomboid family serine protease